MATNLSILEEIFNKDSGHARHACAACDDLLSAYIEAELDGKNAALLYPTVAEHLGTCEECTEDYNDLRPTLAAVRSGTLPVPPTQPTFDFSFLHSAQKTPSLWQVVESAGQEVRRIVSDIKINLSRTAAVFGELPGLLSPQLLSVEVTRAAQPQTPPQMLTLPSSADDLSIGLAIGPVARQEASVNILTTQMSSGQPVPRARVTLRDADRRLLTIEHTDDAGQAHFSHLGSGQYLIEVRSQSVVFELPLTFTLEADPKP